MSVDRIVAAVVIVAAAVVIAGVVDRLLGRRRDLPPESLTRFRALRRTLYVIIIVVGVAAAALVFPTVRGAAGALLTSAAVLGVIIGIAAQGSLGNFVAGLVIAFSQPIRIGDEIEFRGATGVVEDVGRIYTRVRTRDGAWIQVPNGLLASDTIRNWTIVDPECIAQIRLVLPLSADLGNAMALLLDAARTAPGALQHRPPVARVSSLGDGSAELELDVWAADHTTAQRIAGDLRLRAQERLRRAGMIAA